MYQCGVCWAKSKKKGLKANNRILGVSIYVIGQNTDALQLLLLPKRVQAKKSN